MSPPRLPPTSRFVITAAAVVTAVTAAANVAILKLKTCSANSIEVAGEGNEVAVREEMITKFHKHLPHKSKVFSFYLYKCHS